MTPKKRPPEFLENKAMGTNILFAKPLKSHDLKRHKDIDQFCKQIADELEQIAESGTPNWDKAILKIAKGLRMRSD